MRTDGSSLFDALLRYPTPRPKAKESRLGQSPVERISAVEQEPSRSTARLDAVAGAEASTHRSGQTATHEAPRAPHGHDHRTSRGIHESTPSPSEADSSQPAHNSSARRPVAPRYATPRSKPHRRIPTGGLRARAHPVSPRERRLDHGRSSARAAKTFPMGTGCPSENSGASAFRFLTCATASPRAPSAPQGAPRGRAPTRGGRQPWERASTRGRTRQSART